MQTRTPPLDEVPIKEIEMALRHGALTSSVTVKHQDGAGRWRTVFAHRVLPTKDLAMMPSVIFSYTQVPGSYVVEALDPDEKSRAVVPRFTQKVDGYPGDYPPPPAELPFPDALPLVELERLRAELAREREGRAHDRKQLLEFALKLAETLRK